jgi:hypothetical protein
MIVIFFSSSAFFIHIFDLAHPLAGVRVRLRRHYHCWFA